MFTMRLGESFGAISRLSVCSTCWRVGTPCLLVLLSSHCFGGAAACPSPAVVNINARVYGDPESGQQTLDISLAPGVYRASPVCPETDPSALYFSWNPWDPPTPAWESGVNLRFPNNGFQVGIGRIAHLPTPQAAFYDAANVAVYFVLTQPDTARVFVSDWHLGDNQGGVSFRLERLSAAITAGPQGGEACLQGAPVFATQAAGIGSISYRWEWRTSSSSWEAVTEGANAGGGGTALFAATGSQSASVTISPPSGNAFVIGELAGFQVRCLVTDPCGSIPSGPAGLTFLPDFTLDGMVDTHDLALLLFRFGTAAPAGSGSALVDLNGDRVIDTADLQRFLLRFGQSCP